MIATNPILPGFRPDPSIIRFGEEYIIATSTFEWFPGVELHRSRDLVNWELLPSPLDRQSQLDLVGVPDSGGVWAPCLSYDGRRFYLVYTNVKQHGSIFPDTHNFVVTAEAITGPWSEPVFLNSHGADPSLFHDTDGRKWLVVTNAEYRPGHNRFGGILLQEVDRTGLRPMGSPELIFAGTELGYTEGPHLYHIGDYYYLITAEGGTYYGHAVTVARSRNIRGPYEVHPNNPILTSRDDPNHPLQRAGHADLVQSPSGRWYLVHLASRLLNGRKRSVLGRETAIQEIVWDGRPLADETAGDGRSDSGHRSGLTDGADPGWPRLRHGARLPALTIEVQDNLPEKVPDVASKPTGAPTDNMGTDALTAQLNNEPRVGASVVRCFDVPSLPREFKTLRRPVDDSWCSLSDRPGYLRLFGGESLASRFHQSMVARRVEHLKFTAWTVLEMRPASPKHSAGLICYYNTNAWHYLYLSADDEGTVTTAILSKTDEGYIFNRAPTPWSDDARATSGREQTDPEEPQSVRTCARTLLGVTGKDGRLQFYIGESKSADPHTPAGDAGKSDTEAPHTGMASAQSKDYLSAAPQWHRIGPLLDWEILSDEAVPGGGFTGTFVGMCCQDLTGAASPADFQQFVYKSDMEDTYGN